MQIEQGYLFHDRPLVGPDVRYTFPDPNIDDKEAPNFLDLEVEEEPFSLERIACGLGKYAPRVIFPRGLPAGRTVIFHFGDTSYGSPGLAVPTYPLKIRYLLFLDTGGRGDYSLAAAKHPEIEAFASGADRLHLVGPSVAYQDGVRIRIVPVRGVPGLERSSLPVLKLVAGLTRQASSSDLIPPGRDFAQSATAGLDFSVPLFDEFMRRAMPGFQPHSEGEK